MSISQKIQEKIDNALKEYPVGIYFDMKEEIYHSLPYFSRTSAEVVLFDLEEAAHKFLEGNSEPSAAMNFGTAIHAMFLEPEKFKETYVKFPSIDDYADKIILKDCDDLKEFLSSVGEKKTGAKAELIDRVKPFVYGSDEYIIWDELVEEFHANVKENNLKILSADDFETINKIRAAFSKKSVAPLLVTGGVPEVTIIWKDIETGIVCKCRLDYLNPEGVVDIKSFSIKNKSLRNLYEVLANETIGSYYNFQYAIYVEALETIARQIKSGGAKVFGDEKVSLDELLNNEKNYSLLYIRTAAPYQIKIIELKKSSAENGSNNYYHTVAKDMWRMAIKKYSRALKSDEWVEKEVEILEDSHVPRVMYQAPIY